MGGEISIKDKGPGKAGTCIGFNVFMKMGGIHEQQHDIEQGSSSSSQCCIGASAFREANTSFEGGHCMLLVHGDETRRILQSWLENLGIKVWLVPQLDSFPSALENVCHVVSSASPRTPSDSFECHADFCFRSRDTVSEILPVSLKSSSSFKRSGAFGANNLSGVLVVIDAHYGKMENICTEVNFPEIKKQIPCKIVCLADANTSSGDLGRLRHHTCCDLVLQKPIHGSRLYALLNTLRDLQMAQARHHPSHVNPENAETRNPENAGTSAMVALAQSSSSEPKRDDEEKSLTGRRVLLVEDTLTLQTIGKKILYQLGADVAVAEDGAKAVSMFEAALAQANKAGSRMDAAASTPYDVILMDCQVSFSKNPTIAPQFLYCRITTNFDEICCWDFLLQMPVMDGYEATRRIREVESCYGVVHTPIIALTAHAMEDEEQWQKTIAAGMDLHLTKPMERRSIAEAIRRVCVSQE